uniref:Putative ovule protein n=1 Tax=Solanum chacoense TaxID=4108 RepID=A0A0V0GMU0_SOLCH
MVEKTKPEHCNELFPRWTAEFRIHPMLKNPNNRTNKEEEYPSYTPHLNCKWLKESPRTGFGLFDRSNYDESRFHIRLCEVHNPCAICCNCNISNSCIIFILCNIIHYAVKHGFLFPSPYKM